jgi:hypothetical protein
MKKGCIYYSHNDIDQAILSGVQKQILKSGLPIVSCSLKPLDFGENVVLNEKKGIMTYFKQIMVVLEKSTADYVFFCEHDILYHLSHFEFTPPRDDTFYYNTNVWKWNYYDRRVITYDHQASVSGLCVNRKLAIDFYKRRFKIIYERGYDKLPSFGNPHWARELGYEPGKHTSNKLESALAEEWRSAYPIIDIRHTRCMTVPKMRVEGFKKKPVNWKEDLIENLLGWEEPWKIVGADFSNLKKANWINRKT